MALLSDAVRTATVTAVGDSVSLVLRRQQLLDLETKFADVEAFQAAFQQLRDSVESFAERESQDGSRSATTAELVRHERKLRRRRSGKSNVDNQVSSHRHPARVSRLTLSPDISHIMSVLPVPASLVGSAVSPGL